MSLVRRNQRVKSGSGYLRTALFAGTALAAIMLQQPAFADEVKFNIAGQPLASALLDFGRQSGRQVLFNPATLTHLSTKGLNGSFEPTEALRRLSAGSSLVFTEREDGSFIVSPASAVETNDVQKSSNAAPAAVSPASATPAEESAAPRPKTPVVAGGRESDGENTLASSELEEIIVQAKRRGSTATKFELNVVDTPQSIKAVTSDVLDFASIRDFADLVKIDASTNTNGTVQGQPHLSFRGLDFNSSAGIKIDGAPSLAGFPVDFAVFERIEILKGPSSTIYGQNAAGGMVNAVTKRPLSEFKGSVEGKIGSWGFHRAEADIGGPLTQDGKLSFRGVAAYEEGGDFIDFADNQSKVVYGALKYDFDEATSATLIVNYQERKFRPNEGINLFYDTLTIPDIPATRNAGPDWTSSDGDFLTTEAEVSHKFANNWILKFNGQYGNTSRYGAGAVTRGFINHNGDPVNQNNVPKAMTGYFQDGEAHMWSGDISLTGGFDLFGQNHTFYVSVDHRTSSSNYKLANTNLGFLNLFNPDYDALGPVRRTASDFADGFLSVIDDNKSIWGGTIQLLLHPVDRLSVLAGVRLDKSKTTFKLWGGGLVNGDIAKTGAPLVNNAANTTELLPQIGATFELRPELNLYMTYGQSFVPQYGVTFEGDAIAPEQGSQFEGGIKGNFGSVTTTLAIFDVKRTHITSVDPDHIGFQHDIGTQESKGVEVDVFGNILPGWSVYGSFAYLDAKIAASGVLADVGARLFNVPKFSFSLYTDYQFQKGPLTGLGFGGGIVSRQDRVWGLPSFPWLGRQVDGGGYTTVDLRAYYEIGHVMFDVKVNNVTNEKYYNAFFPGLKGGIFPGRPREVIGSVKYRF